MADTPANQNAPYTLTPQQQEWVNRETDLLIKLKQAQANVESAQDQVARAQAQLDDSREQLRSVQSQLDAMYNEPGAVRQGLPPNETYVGGAFDNELARTPGQARYDVLQNESQEIAQEHAVAPDMAQAEDQGVVSAPPESTDQENQG